MMISSKLVWLRRTVLCPADYQMA